MHEITYCQPFVQPVTGHWRKKDGALSRRRAKGRLKAEDSRLESTSGGERRKELHPATAMGLKLLQGTGTGGQGKERTGGSEEDVQKMPQDARLSFRLSHRPPELFSAST